MTFDKPQNWAKYLFLLVRPFAAISSARRIAIECDLKSVKQKKKKKKKKIIRTRNFNWQTLKIWMISKFRFNKKNGHPNQLGVKRGMIQNDKKK